MSTTFKFPDSTVTTYQQAITIVAVCFVALSEYDLFYDEGGLLAALSFLSKNSKKAKADSDLKVYKDHDLDEKKVVSSKDLPDDFLLLTVETNFEGLCKTVTNGTLGQQDRQQGAKEEVAGKVWQLLKMAAKHADAVRKKAKEVAAEVVEAVPAEIGQDIIQDGPLTQKVKELHQGGSWGDHGQLEEFLDEVNKGSIFWE